MADEIGRSAHVKNFPFNDGYACLPLEHCSLSRSLEELSFNGSQWESVGDLICFLKLCVSLRRVSFKCCGLSDDATGQIVTALQTPTQFATLGLGMQAISALIWYSSSLKHLDLSNQVRQGEEFYIQEVARSLRQGGNNLKVLRLAGNLLDDKQVSQLAVPLRSCSLQHSNLSTNDITSKRPTHSIGQCIGDQSSFDLSQPQVQCLFGFIQSFHGIEYLQHSCHTAGTVQYATEGLLLLLLLVLEW
jgi:hypothetical protein